MIKFILILCLLLCIFYILIQVFYLVILFVKKRDQTLPLNEYPFISILVAARNEENNITNCLLSLSQLDYPQDKFEVIIGNDSSTDGTQQVIENFITEKSNFNLINLTGNEYPQTKGKARVLAVLANKAKGEYILITDADIVVGKQWAKGLVSGLVNENTVLAAGTTNIKATTFLTQFQQVDWLYFMGIINAFASVKKPLTAVGNNMAFSKKAYQAIGGYETLPFSITEDYALFKGLRQNGGNTSQFLSANTLVYSQPIDTLKGLLRQRKRWLVGGWDLPTYYRAMIFVFGAWYIALPILFFLNFWLALALLFLKDFIQLFQIIRLYQHLDRKIEHPWAVLFYDIYLFIMIPLTTLFFFWPSKTVWKGRKY